MGLRSLTTEQENLLAVAPSVADPVNAISIAFRISGEVASDRIQDAVEAECAGVPEFAERFVRVGDAWMRRTAAGPPLEFRRYDLVQESQQGRDSALTRQLAALMARDFDVSTDPLVRALLLRTGPSERVLAISGHHLMMDGTALRVLFDKITQRLQGTAAARAPATTRRSSSPSRQENEAYWFERLRAAPRRFELPTYRARPSLEAPPEWLSEDLDWVGGSGTNALLCHATWLAALAWILSERSASPRVPLGFVFHGRAHGDASDVVAHKSKVLPLVFDLAGQELGPRLIDYSLELILNGLRHHEISFTSLFRRLRPGQSMNYLSFFNVIYNGGGGRYRLQIPGAEVSPLLVSPARVAARKFDHALFVDIDSQRAVWRSASDQLKAHDLRALVAGIGSAIRNLFNGAPCN